MKNATRWDNFLNLVRSIHAPWPQGEPDDDEYRKGRAVDAFNPGSKVANDLLELKHTLQSWVPHGARLHRAATDGLDGRPDAPVVRRVRVLRRDDEEADQARHLPPARGRRPCRGPAAPPRVAVDARRGRDAALLAADVHRRLHSAGVHARLRPRVAAAWRGQSAFPPACGCAAHVHWEGIAPGEAQPPLYRVPRAHGPCDPFTMHVRCTAMLGPRGVRLPALWALETVSMIVIRLLRSDLDPKKPMWGESRKKTSCSLYSCTRRIGRARKYIRRSG